VVKIDVEAVGAMLDEMLADPGRPRFDELEPDYEFLEPAPPLHLLLPLIHLVRLGSHIRIEVRDKGCQLGDACRT
jgi:hypothetical protein